MRILEAEIGGFGRHHDRRFCFGPGLNLIEGPNESGKSTLESFLRAMLFGLTEGQARRKSAEFARYMPWNGAPYRGALTYQLQDGRQIRLERQFAPQMRLTVRDAVTGVDLTADFPQDGRKERLFLDEHVGLSAALCRELLFVPQERLRTLEAPENLAQELVTLAVHGDGSQLAARASKKLERELEEIGSPRAPTRPLGLALGRLRDAEARLAQARQQQADNMEREQQLAALNRRLQTCATEAQAARQIWLSHRAAELQQRLQQVHDLEQRLAQLPKFGGQERPDQETLAKLHRLEGELAGLRAEAEALGEQTPPDSQWLAWDVEEARGWLEKASRWRGEIAQNEAALARLAQKPQAAPAIGPVLWPSLLAALLIILGIVGAHWLAMLAALPVIYLLVARARKAAPSEDPARRDLEQVRARLAEERQELARHLQGDPLAETTTRAWLEQIAAAEQAQRHAELAERYRQLQVKMGELEQQKRDLLNHCQVASIADLTSRLQLEQQRRELEARLSSLLGDDTAEGLRLQCAAALDAAQGKAQRAELPDPERRARELERQEQELRGQYAGLKAQIEERERLLGSPLLLEQEVSALRDEVAELQAQRGAIELAEQWLSMAAEQLAGELLPRLSEELSVLAERLTQGRYGELHADQALHITVAAADAGRWLELEELSLGTHDLLCFALRLGLGSLMRGAAQQEPLFLVLDDPLVHLDEQRLVQAMELLCERAKAQQILYFTCHTRTARALELAAPDGCWQKIELAPTLSGF